MEVVDTTQINSFAPTAAQTDFPVSPSEEAVFILNSSQLQDIITKAIEKTIQPLQNEVRDLKATVARQDEKIAALEATQETQADNQLIQLRLINDLRESTKKEPGKSRIARAEKIEKYLSLRPDHKATFETLKGHLGVDKDRLNEAIKTLMTASPGRYGITRTPGDKRKRTLVMLLK
jgi:hypothetical protein